MSFSLCVSKAPCQNSMILMRKSSQISLKMREKHENNILWNVKTCVPPTNIFIPTKKKTPKSYAYEMNVGCGGSVLLDSFDAI